MQALVTLENANEVVEDFELKRSFDKVMIELANGVRYRMNINSEGYLTVMCVNGPGASIAGTTLAVIGESNNHITLVHGVIR